MTQVELRNGGIDRKWCQRPFTKRKIASPPMAPGLVLCDKYSPKIFSVDPDAMLITLSIISDWSSELYTAGGALTLLLPGLVFVKKNWTRQRNLDCSFFSCSSCFFHFLYPDKQSGNDLILDRYQTVQTYSHTYDYVKIQKKIAIKKKSDRKTQFRWARRKGCK